MAEVVVAYRAKRWACFVRIHYYQFAETFSQQRQGYRGDDFDSISLGNFRALASMLPHDVRVAPRLTGRRFQAICTKRKSCMTPARPHIGDTRAALILLSRRY